VSARGTGRQAWGVLYEVTADRIRGRRTDHAKTLAQIEGPHYEEKTIRVRNHESEEVEAITFLVRSSDRTSGLWTSAEYVVHIVKGLRAHDAPEEYVRHVIDTAIETNRRASADAEEQTRLIAELREIDSPC